MTGSIVSLAHALHARHDDMSTYYAWCRMSILNYDSALHAHAQFGVATPNFELNVLCAADFEVPQEARAGPGGTCQPGNSIGNTRKV